MFQLRHAAWFMLPIIPLIASAGPHEPARSENRSRVHQSITGPTHSMNEALAAGATAIITLQPVQPKTVPASNYPMGTVITNETIYLGSVPARVWLEGHLTGWAPQTAWCIQMGIDGDDIDGDGGGYDGDNADCNGDPVVGTGDLFPAIVPCTSNLDCRAQVAGRTSACFAGEPARCAPRPSYFPPGGNVCSSIFQDQCDPEYAAAGLSNFCGVDDSSLHPRWFVALNEPDEVNLNDFAPSYSGTLVLDVPADAKGRYTIDYWEESTFLLNRNPAPNNQIPILELREAVIAVATCSSHMDCDDGDLCTMDSCQGGCCEHNPLAGWDPDTECCNPVSGVQAPIPQSTSCRTGTCTLGGSSGSPTYTNLPDGASCTAVDPCYSDGLCSSGQCFGEHYEGSDCPKPRFISFDVSTGPAHAYRVRLVSLHHPDPPYTGGTVTDFSAYEGEVRWVGPHTTYAESSADPSPVHASVVQCTPHYQDWNSLGLLHVTGAEIVPSSVYEVQSIEQGLNVNIESNYSDPIIIHTGRWGDVAYPYSPPVTTAQPNALDHAALATKFRSAPGAMSKPRALLVGTGMSEIPNLTLDVGFADIAASVDAYRGSPYPYAGPQPCP